MSKARAYYFQLKFAAPLQGGSTNPPLLFEYANPTVSSSDSISFLNERPGHRFEINAWTIKYRS